MTIITISKGEEEDGNEGERFCVRPYRKTDRLVPTVYCMALLSPREWLTFVVDDQKVALFTP